VSVNRILIATVIAILITGCEKGKQYSNVNGEVETPSALVEQTEDTPPHQRFKNVQEACPPLPVKDGFVTVKMKVQGSGDIALRIPEYADIRRHSAMYAECAYATDIFIRYVWFKGQLIPGWDAKFDVPSDKDRRVLVGLAPESTLLFKRRKKADPWRYTSAVPHKFLPLEYYPRYRWESEAGPGNPANSAGIWGVLNTKHRTLDGKPFPTWCPISTSSIKIGHVNLPIEAGMQGIADSRCSGGISMEAHDSVIAARIDVWKDVVPEINHIYDAVYEEVQRFVQ